jgi:cyclohexanone monooxygenase
MSRTASTYAETSSWKPESNDETQARWTVRTDRGDALSVRYCIMATGCLSTAREPEIPGLDTFKGAVYHTGRWPDGEIDFAGKRVGVVGAGSSGIQVAPMIAKSASRLYVFQRTPNFSIPARNTPTDPDRERQWKAVYPEKRRDARETTAGILYEYNTTPALSVSEEQRRIDFEARWRTGGVNFIRTYCDIMLDKAANDTAAEFVRIANPRDRQGRAHRREAAAAGSSHRRETDLHRYRLFPHL